MADTGYRNPGTAATDNAVGSINWASSGLGICGDSGSHYAQATEESSAVITYYIKGTNFGFSIPAGATINGIEFVATKSVSYTAKGNLTIDNAVRIIKGGTIGTTDKKNTMSAWSGMNTDYTYGSSTELWGETWTPDDINSSSFGIALSAKIDNSPNEGIYVYVHDFRLKVYYTPATGPAGLKVVNGLAKASIKTLRSGLAIASGKTWDGLV